eukprot:m.66885 g.66885  ORF g.66885 m.66885 type:complete len:263 (-) comp13613_c2_seq2:2494-3282(-)
MEDGGVRASFTNGKQTSRSRWTQARWCYALLGLVACITLLRLLFSGASGGRNANHMVKKQDMLPFFDQRFVSEQGELPIDQVHKLGLPHFGTVLLVYRPRHPVGADGQDVEFLLAKRGSTLATCAGQWLMVGEHAHKDEDTTDTALRALREELGIFAAEEDVTHLCDVPLEHAFDSGRRENQMTHLVMVEFPTYESIDLDSETDEIRWLSPKQIITMADKNQLCNPATSNLVKDLVMMGCDKLQKQKGFNCAIQLDPSAVCA